jgi:hypothetical protein
MMLVIPTGRKLIEEICGHRGRSVQVGGHLECAPRAGERPSQIEYRPISGFHVLNSGFKLVRRNIADGRMKAREDNAAALLYTVKRPVDCRRDDPRAGLGLEMLSLWRLNRGCEVGALGRGGTLQKREGAGTGESNCPSFSPLPSTSSERETK